MIEPLFWNPLPDAAAWLTQKTGRRMDARTLVDTVTQMGEEGNRAPTIIKAMLPTGLNFASLAILAIRKPAPQPESDVEKFLRERLAKLFGPLPVGVSYLSVAYPTTAPLCVNYLLQLLMHGEFTTGLVMDKNPSDGGMVWLMPWGTEYTATLETCGINRADLLALGDKLTPPAQNTATPASAGAVGASGGMVELDYSVLATPAALLDAFEKWGMKAAWFDELDSHKWLLEARRQKGQGQRGNVIPPMFCPYAVMCGLVSKVRKATRLKPDTAWRTLEHKFPKVHAAFESHDTRDRTGD